MIFLTPRIKEAAIIKADHSSETVFLPFKSNDARTNGIYTYKITLKNSMLSSGNYQIIPDDCLISIHVNGKEVKHLWETGKGCDSKSGIDINLKPYLTRDENVITLEVENTGGYIGLQFVDTTFYGAYQILIPFVLCVLSLILYRNVRVKVCNWLKNLFWKKALSSPLLSFIILILFFYFSGLFIKDGSVYRWYFIWMTVIPVFITCCILIYRKCIDPKFSVTIFSLCTCLCSAYICYHLYDQYSYDVEAHVQYIQYMIDTGHSPNPAGGWLFYHPSFYYRAVAGFWAIASYGRHLNFEEFLKISQAFTLTVFIVYCYLCIMTINLVFRMQMDSRERQLNNSHRFAVLLFLLWPVNAIFSGRIGNDIFFDLFYAMAFYWMVKWWYSQNLKNYFLILIFSSLAVWAKTNGLILIGASAILLICGFFIHYRRKPIRGIYYKQALLLTLAISVILCLSVPDKLMRLRSDPDTPLIVSNATGLGDELRVENNFNAFLTFNPVKFVKRPYTSALNPALGRDNFWHFLLKTSILGEFQETSTLLKVSASMLSLSLLLLMPLFFMGIFSAIKNVRIFLPVIISVLCLIGSMIVFRLNYPFSCSNDFRYIFPAVLPFCVLTGMGAGFDSKKRWASILSTVTVILFTSIATAYQILLVFKY
ncbi:hypothetical protein FHT21_002236 [Pedobacter sp. SG908]|nr:hypothetical protein [Pedobacter sp. SG908]